MSHATFLKGDFPQEKNTIWYQPVENLSGVGEKKAQQLADMGIKTVGDLLHHLPHRYADPQGISQISELEVGKLATVEAVVRSVHSIRRPGRQPFVHAQIVDESGKLSLMFFHQPYVSKQLKVGETYAFTGKPGSYRGQISLTNPIFESVDKATRLQDGSVLPVYPQYQTISTRWLQKILKETLEKYADQLPQEYLNEQEQSQLLMIDRQEAWHKVHFPENEEEAHLARKRLAFDEVWHLFEQMEEQGDARRRRAAAARLTLSQLQNFLEAFLVKSPFPPTATQRQAFRELTVALSQTYPTQYFVQGEVGSGKTLVGAFATLAAASAGHQALYIAPTTILAEQHFQSVSPLAEKFGITTALWTGGSGKNKKQEPAQLIIATHTAFHHKNDLHPAVVVVDEEHRFGVQQRETFSALLENEDGAAPHLITMTATPIPRTLAHVLYGEQNISFLEPIPGKEKQTLTRVVPYEKHADHWEWIGNKIQNEGWQGFCIAPFIEPSETEDFAHVMDANTLFAEASKALPKIRIGLLTGRTPAKEKQKILEAMQNKELDLLVATPVIEVGIDIPATRFISIFSAERFGFAQLHQLRGRVGRLGQESWCFLIPSETSAGSRLKPLEKLHQGYQLAELDLKQRGAGEFLGTQQSGWSTLTIGTELDLSLIMTVKKLRQSRQNSDGTKAKEQ